MTSFPFHLRPAVAADLDAILSLERATDSAPHWPAVAYAAILERGPEEGQDQGPAAPEHDPGSVERDSVVSAEPRRCLIVAHGTENQLLGFAVGLLHPAPAERTSADAEPTAELESVVVAAAARRVGVGRALCGAVLDWCRSQEATAVDLEVRASSSGAIALYTGLGFTQVARRPAYYREPEDDALLMQLQHDHIESAIYKKPTRS